MRVSAGAGRDLFPRQDSPRIGLPNSRFTSLVPLMETLEAEEKAKNE